MNKRMPLVCVTLVLGLSISVSATVLHVPGQYPTIQAGIDAAGEGDTVLVADGTYTGDGNRDLDFGGVNMVVMSENGPEVTIIDCEGSSVDPHRAFFFHGGEDQSSVVQGFEITNGYAVGLYPFSDGGGILCISSSPNIMWNTITDNVAVYAGAISCDYSSARIANNIFVGNAAFENAGAIGCDYSDVTIADNTLVLNSAGFGAGAIGFGNSSNLTITGNMILRNTAGWGGGGIGCAYSAGLIMENTFAENSADSVGGGIGVGWQSSLAMVENTMAGNVAPFGGAVWCDSACTVTMINSILWGDSAALGREICMENRYGAPSSATVSYSDVDGGEVEVYVAPGCVLNWGDGNIDAFPEFVLRSKQDYRLLWGSPCIDAGHPDTLDPDNTRCDMGAYYFDQTEYMTLYLSPDGAVVVPGGLLGVTYTVINRWAQPETFWVQTEVQLPGGGTLNVIGPDRYTLPPDFTVQRYLTHNVPMGAPLGLYAYRSRIGVPPFMIYDEYHFPFWVVAP
ncbi:hypothetical protein AMJ82_07310 [candidate division TA06 bacterium SM23_40]|uniref:Periplasmic copper-binding protein NosD beta helix domain-containing protein n=2 Tax=Bacteria division TA06 TaxID=1156500 RepID=A0A0S8G7D3_UNCT6|nr:MAG: hypothetical protein AMJ82_07310 [candidate division TA06 bacterium SM23_40]